MKRINRFVHFLMILLLAFLIDILLPVIFSGSLPNPFLFSSHFLFIVSLYYAVDFSFWELNFLFFCLGIVTDSMLYTRLGIATFLFPLFAYLIKRHSGLVEWTLTRFLMLIVLIFIYEGGSYGAAFLYGWTKYPLELEITYHLMPTLLFNSVLYFLALPFLKKLRKV